MCTMPTHRYSFSQRFYEPQRPYTATNKLENLPTDRQRTIRDQAENSSKTEATLILCGSSGERANFIHKEKLRKYKSTVYGTIFIFILKHTKVSTIITDIYTHNPPTSFRSVFMGLLAGVAIWPQTVDILSTGI